MKIIQIGIALTLFFIVTPLLAQSSIDDLVEEGIKYHDKGDYDKAIETYKKALEINPESTLVNYEIALSYFSKGDYKLAIKYSDFILNQDADYLIQAIKKTEGHYLLSYNLALNYFKINELDKAQENLINAIEKNPNHASSHLMLANIHHQKGNSVETLLATHYFLFLEPNTKRSIDAYQMLQENFGGNVSKDTNKPNTINIMFSTNNDSQFGAAALMVSMLEASKSLEKNKGKTDNEMFIENTESFFKILGELKDKKSKGIWWTFYTPFFYDLANSDHLETYCNYIAQSSNEDSKKWLIENEKRLIDFDIWLKENS